MNKYCCQGKVIIVKYKEGYEVKFTFIVQEIKEDEGNGWYSVVGSTLNIVPSRIKYIHQFPKLISTEQELCSEHRLLFYTAKADFEASKRHADWMQSMCTIKQL